MKARTTGTYAILALAAIGTIVQSASRAVCAEVLDGIREGHGMTAALLRRLGDLTAPERVADANMLASWKERYRLKITARTKSVWERRLKWTG